MAKSNSLRFVSGLVAGAGLKSERSEPRGLGCALQRPPGARKTGRLRHTECACYFPEARSLRMGAYVSPRISFKQVTSFLASKSGGRTCCFVAMAPASPAASPVRTTLPVSR